MIYCIEDDDAIRELIIYTLQSTGFEAVGFASPQPFFTEAAKRAPELVLLDVMLPGDDGLSVLKKIRSSPQLKKIPVIMITAKTTEIDRVTGLDLGADDYIPKPFGMMELVSRIKAVLRRTAGGSARSGSLSFGGLNLDADKHLITTDGMNVDFTLKEFQLLQLLMENAGLVMTRDVILENIWGYEFDGETRTVDVHLRRIREKIGKYAESIETVRGVGYRFRETDHAE